MTGLISKCTMTLILLAGLTACSGLSVFNENAALEKRFQQRALDLEKQGELNQALLNWRVAAAMNPDNALTSKIITNLADTIEKQSSDQFANGVALFNNGKFDQARLSFIRTLHLKPNHKEALHYIKDVLPLVGYQQYTVQKGDSFTRIAADVYHDADKGYLLAYYNGFDPDKPLLTGTRLILPKFPGPYNQPRHGEKSQAETTASADQGPVKAQTDEKDTTDTKKALVPAPQR